MNKETPHEIPGNLQRMARLLDSQFNIGNFRFGIDPILGLIPGIGDFISLTFSGGFLALAAKHGASKKLLIIMAMNVLLDTIIGSIPIIGQIFDFYFKANNRNARLLQKYYHQGKYQGGGKDVIAVIIVVLVILAALFMYLIWKLIEWIAERL